MVHLVWIPARRKPVLVGEVKKRLYVVCQEVALEKDWEVRAITIEPDHTHLFVQYKPDESVAQVIRAFKGRSSRVLRQEFPHLQKLPSLWTRAYFYSTAGEVSMETIERYINDSHHGG